MSIADAKARLERAGFNVLEQRGFYSHFLRVRVGYETITCMDIWKSQVPGRRVAKLMEHR